VTDDPRGFQTRAIHAVPRNGDALAEGITLATTYAWGDVASGLRSVAEVEPTRFYRRLGGENVAALEARVAALEGAPRALAVGSGMAACSLALMAALPAGGHVVCARTVYGEVAAFLKTLGPRMGITATFTEGFAVEDFARAMRDDTRAVWLECPANPTLDLADLAAVSSLARARGAKTLVDATLATPFNCRPLAHGCDVVVHSATKYLGGHSDAMGGVVAGSAEDIEAMWHLLRVLGPVMAPFDAWLIDRGLRTLGLRMARINESAARVAAFLDAHPAVARVAYPTLPSRPAPDWARAQHAGFGGLLSVEPRGGVEAARRFVESLRLFTLATSLGGVESLAQFPASMARLTAEDRARLGIPASLVRLSVGCEDVDDLLADLDQALRA
jgi:methionine-gamma-lyase